MSSVVLRTVSVSSIVVAEEWPMGQNIAKSMIKFCVSEDSSDYLLIISYRYLHY